MTAFLGIVGGNPSTKYLTEQVISKLQEQRCLLVLDNFEYVVDEQEDNLILEGKAFAQFQDAGLQQSRLLLTSWKRPRDSSYRTLPEFPLPSLDPERGVELLKELFYRSQGRGLSLGEEPYLNRLSLAFGGNPRLMELFVAQTARGSALHEVYEDFSRTSWAGVDAPRLGFMNRILQEVILECGDVLTLLCIVHEPLPISLIAKVCEGGIRHAHDRLRDRSLIHGYRHPRGSFRPEYPADTFIQIDSVVQSWYRQNLDETAARRYHGQLAKHYKQVVDVHRTYEVTVLYELARHAMLAGDIAMGYETWFSAPYRLYQHLLDEGHYQRMVFLLDRLRGCYEAGFPWSDRTLKEQYLSILLKSSFVHSHLQEMAIAEKEAWCALEIARELDDPYGMALSLDRLATPCKKQGRYEESFRYRMEAKRVAENLDRAQLEAGGKRYERRGNLLSELYNDLGADYRQGAGVEADLRTAYSYYQKALEVSEEDEDLRGKAIYLGKLALIEQEQGQYEEAIRHLEEAIEICREHHYTYTDPT